MSEIKNMKLDWYKLDKMLVNAIVDSLDLDDNAWEGRKITREMAYNDAMSNLYEGLNWKWDGFNVKFSPSCGCKEVMYFGPFLYQFKTKQQLIENKLTEVYKEWAKPYLDELMTKIKEAQHKLKNLDAPLGRICLPENLVKFIGSSTLLEIGLHICGECFETIEREIIKKMPMILKWYRRILENQSKFTKEKLIELNKTDPNTKMSKIFNKEG